MLPCAAEEIDGGQTCLAPIDTELHHAFMMLDLN